MRTDAELIQQYQEGQNAAFDELAKRYLQDIFRFFNAMVQNEEDAEDLTQTTLFKLYKGLHQFRFQAEFKTYLYKINTNVVRNYLRKKKIRSIFSFEEPNENLALESDDKEPEFDKDDLWRSINSLPHKQKMVVIMRLSQQLPFKDIGDILGMNTGTAKVNYHYGIKSLQGSMKELV